MSSKPYGIICPISMACALLEPRWTIQILCEMWAGSSRFNDIRRGLGSISPALLSRRLKELEALGLVERHMDRATGAVDYFRTDKAIDLEPAFDSLARWAQRNIEAEIALRELDTAAMMWNARRYVGRAELPTRRVVMRFHFTESPAGQDCYWLVAQPGSDVDICVSDPHLDADLYVEITPVSMAAIMLGRSTPSRETEEGRLYLSGDARLIRTIDRWFPREADHYLEGALPLRRPRIAAFEARGGTLARQS